MLFRSEILREKFGEDITIKKFEKQKSWLNKKLSGANESQIDNLLNILEEKSIWQRMAEKKKGKEPPAFLSTHPSSKKRIENLNGWINEVIIKYPPIKV